jgi:hypothetical protein
MVAAFRIAPAALLGNRVPIGGSLGFIGRTRRLKLRELCLVVGDSRSARRRALRPRGGFRQHQAGDEQAAKTSLKP